MERHDGDLEDEPIDLDDVTDDELRDTLAGALTHDGCRLNIFGMLGHHPKLLKRFNLLGGFILKKGLIRERDVSWCSCESDGTRRPSTSSDAGLVELNHRRVLPARVGVPQQRRRPARRRRRRLPVHS